MTPGGAVTRSGAPSALAPDAAGRLEAWLAAPLDALRRALCRALRAGDLPPGAEPRLRKVLLAAVRCRLAVSNPEKAGRGRTP